MHRECERERDRERQTETETEMHKSKTQRQSWVSYYVQSIQGDFGRWCDYNLFLYLNIYASTLADFLCIYIFFKSVLKIGTKDKTAISAKTARGKLLSSGF